MKKIRLLLVEDEATLAMIIQETLESEGFEVHTATDGAAGIKTAEKVDPDVIVADIMMPRMDGFEMVRRIRRAGCSVPVLFLTARSAVSDVVEGFETGGNDYLRKPFSMQELIVRIRALAQRFNTADQPIQQTTTIKIGLYTLNTMNQILSFCQEEGEELSNRESELLKMLAQNINEVVESRNILIHLWGDNTEYNARSLQVFITKLRHRLCRDEGIKIINVRGIGYKMIV